MVCADISSIQGPFSILTDFLNGLPNGTACSDVHNEWFTFQLFSLPLFSNNVRLGARAAILIVKTIDGTSFITG